MNKPMSRSKEYLMTALAALIAVFVIWYGATGVRGSDQYWYLADVESLAAGEGPYSPSYFPGPLLRADLPTSAELPPNYFLHNSPVMRIVAALANTFTSYRSWIIVNTISHILIALCIISICNLYVERLYATAVASVYLLSPLALWQSMNVLVETFVASLLAVFFTTFVYLHALPPDRSKENSIWVRYITFSLLLATLFVGALSNPLFKVIGLGYASFLLLSLLHNNDRLLRIFASLSVIGVVFAVSSVSNQWFPKMLSGGVPGLVVSAIPNQSNMLMFYSEALITLDFPILVAKLKEAARMQLFVPSQYPMLLYANLGLLSFLWLLLFRFSKYRLLLLSFGLALSCYFAILILHQNQVRYAQLVSIAIFVSIALFLHELVKEKRIVVFGWVIALALNSAVALVLVQKSRLDAQHNRMELENLTSHFSIIEDEARVVLFDRTTSIVIAHALRPRKVLALDTDLISVEQIEEVVALFKPEYLLANQSEVFPIELKSKAINTFESTRFGNLTIHRLTP